IEETVKVTVPGQVLDAMAHPIPMDSELKAAAEVLKTQRREKTPAPAIAPTPPPMARLREMPPVLDEVEPQTAPMDPEKAKKESVDLQDNLAVTDETFVAGAAALPPEEAEVLELVPRSRPTWLIAAALLAVLTTALAV